MAAERPPCPASPVPGAAPPAKAAAPPPADAETPQDPSQAGSSPATRLGESRCSQEFVLDRTFAVCDPEQTGTVTAQGVLEYLQEVTGCSGDEGQLKALRRMLDPEAAGAAVDLPTFQVIMREWIASCQQEGGSQLAEERDAVAGDLGLVLAAGEGRPIPAAAQLEGDGGSVDLTGPTDTASLLNRAEQLAARNAKLQRDIESAEELNARLAEEAAQLKAQLRCSQQALEQARAAAGELEDLTAMAKGLEEENTELQRQTHHLEKEQRCLRLQAHALQEENQQLLAERHGLAEQSQALAMEKAKLEAQLRDSTALLSSHDMALAQAKREAAEVTAALEEYERVVQELQLEVTQLRAQLSRVQDMWDTYVTAAGATGGTRGTWPWCPPGEADVLAQPLSTEIKETEEEEEKEEEEEAATPRPPSEDEDALVALQQHPDTSESSQVPLVPLAPQAPRALRALVLLLALVSLVLLVSLCILPRHWPGPPPGPAAWPQLQLRYWRPPPQ